MVSLVDGGSGGEQQEQKPQKEQSSSYSFQKEYLYGGPVTAVSFYQSNVCYYGHGPHLHYYCCLSPETTTTTTATIVEGKGIEGEKQQQQKEQSSSLLVFPLGGTIHGIQYVSTTETKLTKTITTTNTCRDHNTTTTRVTHDQYEPSKMMIVVPPKLIVVFGGQQISFLQHLSGTTTTTTIPKVGNLQVIPILQQKQQQQKQHQEQHLSSTNHDRLKVTAITTTTNVFTLSDWIWDCHCSIPTICTDHQECDNNNNHHHDTNPNHSSTKTHDTKTTMLQFQLTVALAHNTIECYQIKIHSSFSDSSYCGEKTTTTTTTREAIATTIMNENSNMIDVLNIIPICIYRGNTRCISYCMNIHPMGTQVAVGTVMNEILVWDIPPPQSSTISSSNHQNTTSTHNSNNHNNIRVQTIPKMSRLLGHEGVIHAVQYNKDHPSLLASTSDDRSVRVWEEVEEEQQQPQNGVSTTTTTTTNHKTRNWVLKWTGWGHTARGWDIQFTTLPKWMVITKTEEQRRMNDMKNTATTIMSDDTEKLEEEEEKGVVSLLLSTGEDGTLRIWDYNREHPNSSSIHNTNTNTMNNSNHNNHTSNSSNTNILQPMKHFIVSNQQLAVIRGHSCQCVWKVDTSCDVAVTAGNDGTIAFYHIPSRIPLQQSVRTTTVTSPNNHKQIHNESTWHPKLSNAERVETIPNRIVSTTTSPEVVTQVPPSWERMILIPPDDDIPLKTVHSITEESCPLISSSNTNDMTNNTEIGQGNVNHNTKDDANEREYKDANGNDNQNNDDRSSVYDPSKKQKRYMQKQQQQTNQNITKKKKNPNRSQIQQQQQQQQHQQVIVGMNFYRTNHITNIDVFTSTTIDGDGSSGTIRNDPNSSSSSYDYLVVATRSGAFHIYNLQTNQWLGIKSWCPTIPVVVPVNPTLPSTQIMTTTATIRDDPSSISSSSSNTGTTDGINHDIEIQYDIQSTTTLKPTDGCCMTIHSHYPLAVIGTIPGDIILVPFHHQVRRHKTNTTLLTDPRKNTFGGSGADDVESSDNRCRSRIVQLCGLGHRAVQRCTWLTNDILLSFHVRTCLWWMIDPLQVLRVLEDDNNNNSNKVLRPIVLRLSVPTKTLSFNPGMPISGAYHEPSKLLAIGDTRGNIYVYSMSVASNQQVTGNQADTTGTAEGVVEVFPCTVLPRAHQKEHVTNIIWSEDGKRIVSVGNDGQLLESILVILPGTVDTTDGNSVKNEDEKSENDDTVVVGNMAGPSNSSCDRMIRLDKLIGIPVGACTGLQYVWFVPSRQAPSFTSFAKNMKYDQNTMTIIPNQQQQKQVLVVGGYHGNRFVVIDVNSGYEYLSIDTGGRQRLIDIHVIDRTAKGMMVGQPSFTNCCIAICITNYSNNDNMVPNGTNGGGQNAIYLQMNNRDCSFRHDHALNVLFQNDYYRSLASSPTLGVPLHGETIFDLCAFPLLWNATAATVVTPSTTSMDVRTTELFTNHQYIAVVSGSEDCTAKISVYDAHRQRITYTKSLPPMVSGIRAVVTSQFDLSATGQSSTTTLLVIGGKINVQCYLIESNSDNKTSHDPNMNIHYVGVGKAHDEYNNKMDHRINTVKAVPLDFARNNGTIVNQQEQQHCIAAGDSNGNCYIYHCNESYRSQTMTGQLLYRHERPIVSLEMVLIPPRHNQQDDNDTTNVNHRFLSSSEVALLLFIGSTGGDVLMFQLNYHNQFPINGQQLVGMQQPLLKIQCHSMGTNTISARIITRQQQQYRCKTLETRSAAADVTTAPGRFIVRLGTGGDDQAISCHDIEIMTQTRHRNQSMSIATTTNMKQGNDIEHEQKVVTVVFQEIQRSTTYANAGLSALKGVRWIRDDLLISTGYDQQLSLWKWDDDENQNRTLDTSTTIVTEMGSCTKNHSNCIPVQRSIPLSLCKVTSVPVDVGDINCLAQCPIANDKHFIAVGGAGMEIITLSIDEKEGGNGCEQ